MFKIECPKGQLTADRGVPSVRCLVLVAANDGESIGGWTEKGQANEVMSGIDDPGQCANFCCRSEPTLSGEGKPGYTNCSIWRAHKEAVWAARDEIRDEQAIIQHGPKQGARSVEAKQIEGAIAELEATR